MATIVESPGIASAKEEAAAILYAHQPQPTFTSHAAPQAQPQIIQTTATRPTLASYREPEPMPTVSRPVNTTEFRPYKTFDEVKPVFEPQVIAPYIDNSQYVTSPVAATSVVTAEPVATVAPQTTTVMKSVLDTELEEDTQYIVKFKTSTIVAATIVATIFLLMAVLCIVNVVSLVTTSAQVSALMEESTALHETLDQEMANLEQARQVATDKANSVNRETYYVEAESTYTPAVTTTASSSFFDWLCHSLSRLFG